MVPVRQPVEGSVGRAQERSGSASAKVCFYLGVISRFQKLPPWRKIARDGLEDLGNRRRIAADRWLVRDVSFSGDSSLTGFWA